MTGPSDEAKPTPSQDPSSDQESQPNQSGMDPFATHPSQGETPGDEVPEFVGRYRIDRILGKGSFGRVYLGHDDELVRPVAIKIPHLNLIANREDAKSYLLEARTVAILDHPHIVPVYDVGTTDKIPCYIVTKYIAGSDLSSWTKLNLPTPGVAAELVLILAEALHYAHRQGVVHRDVKPSNIIIDNSNRPYLVDFGLALQDKDVGFGSGFAGTPAYMSPEQAKGQGNQVDGRSDVFSLGVVFYEMLVKRLPFHGSNSAELFRQIIARDPKPPRQIDDTIDKDLERICLCALSKQPGDRYTTARDLADELRLFLQSRGTKSSANSARSRSATDFVAGVKPENLLTTLHDSPASSESDLGPLTEKLPLKQPESQSITFISPFSLSFQSKIGDFQILEKLGQGGMGAVYRAWHPLLRRQVALKVLLSVGNELCEKRFAREIRALGPVRDEHLAEVFSSGTENGLFYYTMELIEGTTLDTVCQQLQQSGSSAEGLELSVWKEAVSTICDQSRPTDPNYPMEIVPILPLKSGTNRLSLPAPSGRTYVQHVTELVRQIAGAAHKLHEAGAVHRDIKPANIMVGVTGQKGVLIDLGLAQLADETDGNLTRTRQFVGTLRYASPEQVLAVGKVDRRSDVYSLGATLWELLTLQSMFGANDQTSTPELMRRIQFEEAPSVRQFNRKVPKDLDAIVQKCLEKNPDNRYESAHELSQDLEYFLSGRPVMARPVGRLQRTLRRFNRLSPGLRLAMVVIVGLLAVMSLSQYQSSIRWKELKQAKQQISDELRDLELEPKSFHRIEQLISQLKSKFPDEERDRRAEFLSTWRLLIQRQINRMAKFENSDIQLIRECIGLFPSDFAPTSELQSLLNNRVKLGSTTLELLSNNSESIDDALERAFGGAVMFDNKENGFKNAVESEYLQSNIEAANGQELEVVFEPQNWRDKRVGIFLNSVNSRIGNENESSTSEQSARKSEPPAMGLNVVVKGRNFLPKTRYDKIAIRRGETVLRERDVDLESESLRLRWKADGDTLSFDVNDFPSMNLVDFFSIGVSSAGKFGLMWPKETNLRSLKLVDFIAKETSPLEEADMRFSRGNFRDAEKIYRELSLHENKEVAQEARYKLARSLVALKKLSEASQLLKELSHEPGIRWPILSSCELCSVSLKLKRYEEADDAIGRVHAIGTDKETFSSLLERLDSEILELYSLEMTIPRQLQSEPGVAKGLCDLVRTLQMEVVDYPFSRQIKTAMLLGSALQRNGIDDRAEGLYQNIVTHFRDTKEGLVFSDFDRVFEITRNLIWLQILHRRPDEAARAVEWLESITARLPGFGTLVYLEKCRVLYALGRSEEALSCIETFFEQAKLNFDSNQVVVRVELAEGYLLKGVLLKESQTENDAWAYGYNNCKSPELVSDIRFSMLGSVSQQLSDADARLMISQVSDKLESFAVPVMKMIGLNVNAEKDSSINEIIPALKMMWYHPRGYEFLRRYATRQAPLSECLNIQIPLCIYEAWRNGALGETPSEELDDMAWETLTQLFEMYKKREIMPWDVVHLYLSWLGRFEANVMNRVFLPKNPVLRAKFDFFNGCRLNRVGKPKEARVFLEDAMKYATDSPPLVDLIRAELEKSLKIE